MLVPANLAIAIVKHKTTKLARLYFLLRTMSIDGKVTRAALDARWHELGFSPVYLRQLLRQGAGTWWKTGTTRDGVACVFAIGAARVCATLDTDLGTRWVEVPEALLGASLKDLRAHLYAAAMFATDRPVTMSRTTIRGKVGISTPTQRTYERKTKTQVHTNKWITGRPCDEFPPGMLGDAKSPRQAGFYLTTDRDGNTVWAKRLSNTYNAHPGIVHRHRKPRCTSLSTCPEGTRQWLRRYFLCQDEYTSCRHHRAPVCYLREWQDQAGEWQWTCIDRRRVTTRADGMVGIVC